MADKTPAVPAEIGAKMDYEEHEKTYALFLSLAKWGAIVCGGLLVAMAFAFFTTAGFFSGLLLFIIICVVAGFLLR